MYLKLLHSYIPLWAQCWAVIGEISSKATETLCLHCGLKSTDSPWFSPFRYNSVCIWENIPSMERSSLTLAWKWLCKSWKAKLIQVFHPDSTLLGHTGNASSSDKTRNPESSWKYFWCSWHSQLLEHFFNHILSKPTMSFRPVKMSH